MSPLKAELCLLRSSQGSSQGCMCNACGNATNVFKCIRKKDKDYEHKIYNSVIAPIFYECKILRDEITSCPCLPDK